MRCRDIGVEGKFVDVWEGCLSVEPGMLSGMLETLNETEQQKAAAFRLPLMRQRYIAVRYLVRKTLGQYLQTEPQALQFCADTYGKPFLACGSLHFNISHTADLLMIAVANFPDIGIDVESIKPRGSLDGLAVRCFTDTEYHGWRQLSGAQQQAVFYRLWTKKEAFVKAVGRGIALGLEKCEVQLPAGGQLVNIPAEFGSAADWRITELPTDADSAAALVTPNHSFTLGQLSLSPSLNRAIAKLS